MVDKLSKSAAEREAAKTDEQRAEDVAYTINHAAACTTLDVLNTPVEIYTQKYLGKKISVSYCPSCNTDHAAGDHTSNTTRAGRWIVAEMVGDWVGVIPAVLMQRYAPSFMEGLGKGLTYVAGPAFRFGADNSAKKWGEEHGLAGDDTKVKSRADEIYAHEINHLPQAAIWTVSSTALALGALRLQGDKERLTVNLASKLVGASSSILGVLGVRAFAPDTARKWDKWSGENIFLPTTHIIGNTIGIDGNAIDRMAKHQQDLKTGQHLL